jgi:hypothetical protein
MFSGLGTSLALGMILDQNLLSQLLSQWPCRFGVTIVPSTQVGGCDSEQLDGMSDVNW